MLDRPAALISLIVSSYWLIVLLKLALSRVRYRRHGAIPRLTSERRIWPVWLLAIVAWHALPMIAMTHVGPWYALPEWALSASVGGVRMAASCAAVGLFAATVYCWIAMGRNWSVAVIPGELKTLVTNGPFRIVRHPIYSLSIQLMLCSLIVVPNVPMLLVAATHIALMRKKVRIEEQALAAEFGAAWTSYAARTGQLLPIRRRTSQPLRTSPPAPNLKTAGARQERPKQQPARP